MRTLCLAVAAAALACMPRDRPAPLRNIQLEPDLVIGSEADGPASFGDLRAFTVDHQGRIFALEAQAQEVRVFDSTGAYLRTVGRAGAGPGELQMANGLALGPGDHLWVYDPGNARVTIFDTAGVLSRTYSIQITSYGFVWQGGVDPSGRLYDNLDIPEGTSTRAAIGRFDLEHGHADTLPMPRCEAPHPLTYRFARGVMQVPYSSGSYRGLDARGVAWCGDTRHVQVNQYFLGDTLVQRIFAAPATPATVNAAERDSAVASVEAFMKRAGAGTPDYSLIPATKPVLLRVDADDLGRLWVQIEAKDGYQALVFDSLGTLTAVAALPYSPAPWLPTIVRGGHLYAVTRDSLDIPRISRFRLH